MDQPFTSKIKFRIRWRDVLGMSLLIVVTWHLVLGLALNTDEGWKHGADKLKASNVSVNPVTNLVTVWVESDNSDDGILSGLGDALAQGFGPGIWENWLNVRARERLDVYAMLIPYCVRHIRNLYPHGHPGAGGFA